MRMAALFTAMITLTMSSLALPASWSLHVADRDGLPELKADGVPAFTTSFAWWDAQWKWAEQQTQFAVQAPFRYAISGRIPALDIQLSGRALRSADQELSWDLGLAAGSARPHAIGGGLSFVFDLPAFGKRLGEPELLPGNAGWRWGRKDPCRVEVRFDPPLAAVYFEHGRKNEIRAWFWKDGIREGAMRQRMVINAGDGVAVGPTDTERFGLDDPATWPSDMFDANTAPVDLSFLNESERPAGKHGFVRARGDALVFEDGTPARFWGTNLTAYALFGTAKEEVVRQARRLSELGFNLVRLHHHDSPWVRPNVFGNGGSDTRTLDPAMLGKLDWWIKCLEEQGIYVWLDLHTLRALKSGDDIDGFDELAKGRAEVDLRGYNYVNADIRNAMARFDAEYLTHRNSYTALAYKDDPAIVALSITNENDLTHHFGNALLPDKNVPQHGARYLRESDAFARAHGLDRERTWRSWEPGPSKLFLNDLEYRFDAEMISGLRSLGVRAPIVTTNAWGAAPLSSLPALAAGDLIDAHAYGGPGELERSPLLAPNLVHWIAAAHVPGKPLSVSEWNVEPASAADRHAMPLYIAAAARHQGWNAMMQFAYTQTPPERARAGANWQTFDDPAMIAMLPAAALLYRQGHVREATTTYALTLTKSQFFDRAVSPTNSAAIRTAAELGKLVVAPPAARELPWLRPADPPVGSMPIRDPDQSLLDADAGAARSDTGELRHDWRQGTYTIETPRTQAALGWIGGRRIELADTVIAIETPSASVAIQSVDGTPLRQSNKILISMAARSVVQPGRRASYRSEPVRGTLELRAPGGLALVSTQPGSARPARAALRYQDGAYVIDLHRPHDSLLLLQR